MVWPAVIAAGASIAGGLMSKNAQQSRNFQGQLRLEHYAREDTRYQRAVADAKKAGLHPLFALGAGGVAGPSGFVSSGGGERGAVGRGVSRAGAQIAAGMRREKDAVRQGGLDALQREEWEIRKKGFEIQNERDFIKLTTERQIAAMGRQSGFWGDGDPGITGSGVGDPTTKVYPYSAGPRGVPLEMRPTVATARQSMPLRAELIADDGWRYRVLNPDANMDEIGQAELVYMWVMRKTRQARLAMPREAQIWIKRWASKRKRSAKVKRFIRGKSR